MKHLLHVVALMCLTATFIYSQETCDGPMELTLGGAETGAPLEVTGDATQPACDSSVGLATGAIDLTVTGGNPPYTYAWEGAVFDPFAEDQANLVGGNYAVTIIDSKGCVVDDEFELLEPVPMQVIGIPTNSSCSNNSGLPTGGIDIVVTGGSVADDYNYFWSTNDGGGHSANEGNQSGLASGSQTYRVINQMVQQMDRLIYLSREDRVVIFLITPIYGSLMMG